MILPLQTLVELISDVPQELSTLLRRKRTRKIVLLMVMRH